jgi:DNA repair protein RadC
MQTTLTSLLNNVAEVQLSYKSKVAAKDRPQICNSGDAERIFRTFWDQNIIELQETFMIILLNRANRVIGVYKVSNGGLTGTVADVRLIFVAALKAAAGSIILAHNHPSGNLNPSGEDSKLTLKIRDAGKLLDIQVLDHLILGEEGYFSFADQGMI